MMQKVLPPHSCDVLGSRPDGQCFTDLAVLIPSRTCCATPTRQQEECSDVGRNLQSGRIYRHPEEVQVVLWVGPSGAGPERAGAAKGVSPPLRFPGVPMFKSIHV